MVIVHTFKDAYPIRGGIENHMLQLARLQHEAGHDVRILTCHGATASDITDIDGVRLVRYARGPEAASQPLSPKLYNALRGVECDILHVHSPFPLAEWAVLRGVVSSRVVVTLHAEPTRAGWLLPRYLRFLNRSLARVDAVLVTHPAMRDRPLMQGLSAPCHVVPLGIGIPPEMLEKPTTSDGPEEPDSNVVLFVGKFRHYKGLKYLVEACSRIPGIKLVLVGDGPLKNEMQALATDLKLGDRVVFTGEIEEPLLHEWIQRAAILVLPSTDRSEAFGLVLLEAMAASRPVVSTSLGTGTSWVNQHGRTGLVVPPCDVGALAGAIGKLMADRNLRIEMGKAARMRVEAEFDERQMMERVMKVYQQASKRLS